jgi:predicted GH43/DUF377 family glycosyl hydrolase
LALPEEEVEKIRRDMTLDYGRRHRDIERVFARHYELLTEWLPADGDLSEARKLALGAYFTMEYSVESAALFNPSIVPHPDQSGLSGKRSRVIISLRATGEGHISSIEFRTAVIDERNQIHFDIPSGYLATAQVTPDRRYNKHLFTQKIYDMSLTWEDSPTDAAMKVAGRGIIDEVLNRLGEWFTLRELREGMNAYAADGAHPHSEMMGEVFSRMLLLAHSNYQIRFSEESEISDRVIFPTSATEIGGVEDARFVQFTEEDGRLIYYATYTAYDRYHILTQILETEDFREFQVHTLNGKFAQSKGMALFPRRINGKYAMISRIDGENLYLMYSDNVHFWNEAQSLQIPRQYWELVQIGNCGSPIETEAGWLLLTHGVGPMRFYSIGVTLLDLEDPSKVIGQLDTPLLVPEEEEREGYVPNVVYSCGAMIHNGDLIVPYAISDRACRMATVPLDDLLDALLSKGGS